jgi:hypothetical protein
VHTKKHSTGFYRKKFPERRCLGNGAVPDNRNINRCPLLIHFFYLFIFHTLRHTNSLVVIYMEIHCHGLMRLFSDILLAEKIIPPIFFSYQF